MANKLYKLASLARRKIDFRFDHMQFPLHNLSRQQAGNYLLSKLESRLRTVRPWSYPPSLQLEPTIVCQLNCPHCPRIKAIAGQEIGHMNIADYQRLMAEVGPYLAAIAFWQWGEPLLHPQITEMIRIAHDFNILTFVSTNGQVDLHSFDMQAFIESGLDMLIISMDGFSQEVYEKFRQGGSVQSVKRFTRAAVKVKQELARTSPIINLRTIAIRETEHEIPKMREFAGSVGADVFSVKAVSLYYNDDPNHPALPENRAYRSFQYKGPAEAQAYRLRPNRCTKPWAWPTLRYDGTLLVCECDHSMSQALGNVFLSPSFKQVWTGEKATAMRKQFPHSGKAGLEFCKRCRYKLDDAFPCVEYLR